jgi:transcriptional regulator with XRE-family HTH domain
VFPHATTFVKSSSPHRRAVTNRLWRYRKERQLSQRRVARLLGHRTGAQISRWESGEKIPTLDNALMLAHVLEGPVESLFADRVAELRAKIEAHSEKKRAA